MKADQMQHHPRTNHPINTVRIPHCTSFNNGMSLEAIAAMLGHRSMRMTLVYARIADRTVADQYFAAADAVDQLYTTNHTNPTVTDPPDHQHPPVATGAGRSQPAPAQPYGHPRT